MEPLTNLLALATAYAAHTGLSESTVSRLVLKNGSRLRELREGGDIGVRRVDAGLTWFSAHWPDGVDWPAGVPRPYLPSKGT